MPSAGSNENEKIIEGLVSYATALGDRDAARFGGMLYKRVSGEIDSHVRDNDVCKLAFPSFLVRPDLRVECFVAVLQDRLVIAWKAGAFRKAAASVIPFAGISGIRRERGKASGTRGAVLLVISGAPGVTLALPVDKTDAADAVIRSAIGPVAG